MLADHVSNPTDLSNKSALPRSGIILVIMMMSWYGKAFPLLAWWRHQMETFSTLLAICTGNSPVPGEYPAQRPVIMSFDLHLNKWLSKQSSGWWFETPSRPLWRHYNGNLWRESISHGEFSHKILVRERDVSFSLLLAWTSRKQQVKLFVTSLWFSRHNRPKKWAPNIFLPFSMKQILYITYSSHRNKVQICTPVNWVL